VKIRKATADDIPFMFELDRASATSAHWTEPQYRNLLRPERLVLVASREQEPAATAIKEPLLGFVVALQVAPEWELENVVVASDARRTRVGMRLLEALFDAARKTNSEAVFLEVRESNHTARLFYEKSGFGQSGRRKSYYSNPLEDAVLYRLVLTKPFS
jgi:ribosomal-protein-alanine N-acetyltransferase